MREPLVSVVMPVCNAQKYVKEAIESILGQTYTHYEFIIIDDASTDNSFEIVNNFARQDKRIKIYRNEKNLKIAKSLNKGIDYSIGKYIVRMDADDVSLPNRIESQVLFMESNPEVGVSGAQAHILGTKNTLFKTFYLNDLELRASLLLGTGIIHPTAIIRKSVLDKLCVWYNSDFDFADDVELWFRISKISKLANQSDVLLKYRWHETNWTKVYRKNICSDLKKLRKLIYKDVSNYNINEKEQLFLFYRNTKDLDLNKLISFYRKIYFNSNSDIRISLKKIFMNDLILNLSSSSYFKPFIICNLIFSPFLNLSILRHFSYWAFKKRKIFL